MMLNIHLVKDEKFINDSIVTFEKYYPGKNVFIVNGKEEERRYVTPKDNVIFMLHSDANLLNCIQQKHSLDDVQKINVLVHFLTRASAYCALNIKKHYHVAVLYWIFYGADLYSYLEVNNKYDLYDYRVKSLQTILREKIGLWLGRHRYMDDFCRTLDYFCFWNYYDYQLLCKYIKTNAKFRLFFYISYTNREIRKKSTNKDLNVLVNHSASLTGNHITVLKKLHTLSINDNARLLFPLSYGSKKNIALIKDSADKLFPNQCIFIEEYMPLDKYYELINNCQCAIMGHRRQEAGGNINFLLKHGKKIFLRDENSLLNYYRDLGCYVYSFENELNSADDLCPLSIEQQGMNHEIVIRQFAPERIDEMMLHLFDE